MLDSLCDCFRSGLRRVAVSGGVGLLFLVLLAACAPTTGIFAGGRWQPSGLSQHIRTLAVNIHNTQQLYAGDTTHGVFATMDAGLHWNSQSVGLPLPLSVQALAFDAPETHLYATTDRGVFVSANSAKSWQAVTGLPAGSYNALTFDLDHANVFYVNELARGLFKTTDGGHSWTASHNGLPSGASINQLTYDSTQRQLWAATTLGVYRSDDGAQSWQARSQGLPDATIINAVLPAQSIGGAPGLVFAGTNRGFFISHDAGASWGRGKEPLPTANIRTLLADFSTPTTLYIGIDGAVLRSLDSGQTWSGLITGLPARQPVYALLLGADGYSQLYAAVNDVYQNPGQSGGFDLTRTLALIGVVLFFVLLYWLSGRNRRNRRKMLVNPSAVAAAQESDTKEAAAEDQPPPALDPPSKSV